MDLNWSLKELYDSFEGEAFQADLNRLEQLITKYNQEVNEITENHNEEAVKLEKYIDLVEQIKVLVDTLENFAMLSMSVNSKDEQATKYEDVINQKVSNLAGADTRMSEWISEINHLDKVINSSPKLKNVEFYLKEIVMLQKHMLKEKEEMMLAKLKNTGSTAWANYKNLLISNHKVDIELDGKLESLPLTVVLNMSSNKDAKIRKCSYEAEIASYKKIEDGVAAALNAIKGEVITTAQLRGYSSPLEMTLEQSRMTKEILDAMLTAMKEALPSFRKYLRRKAELLGYQNGLPFYELYAPVIDEEMQFTYEEGKAFVEKQFATFDASLAQFANRAFNEKWIDVLPKEGKVGGAFCSGIHAIGQSRILLNYGDHLGDAITMAHELGHGYHDFCLKDESILNIAYPMPLAETASTFCETIVKKAAIREFDKKAAFAVLETEISDATQVIVDIYSRYLFESEVFRLREESTLTVEQFKDLMLNAQKAAYGDGLDPEYLHPYMWTWKPHYYDADYNFYNFPYAFGLLFAKGLYAQYLKDKEHFPAVYKKLLTVTGKMAIEDVTRCINIDVTKPEFWRESLRIVEEDINEFIRLSHEI